MSNKKNIVKFNICNVHYALLAADADGNISCGTSVTMLSTVSLSLNPNDNYIPDKYAEIKSEIRHIYDESKENDYCIITKELNKTRKINHKTVQRLMRKMGIFCCVRMKKYNNSFIGETGRIAPDFLECDFKIDRPNQKRITDVTEFTPFCINLYLSLIIDLYNGEIAVYNLSRHPNLYQVKDMLEKAFAKIPDNTNLILHSDQVWQYQQQHYQKMPSDK